jgi:hypothetical protein
MVLLCHAFTFPIFAQTTKIKGVVTDESGTGIPGATIKIKGATGGTVADATGNFTITSFKGQKLIITAIGFETKEITVDGPTLNVSLGNDKRVLSEIVVTGVGTATSKRKLGIAVESVTAEKLNNGPSISIDQALVGKIPGAQISYQW